MTRDRNNRKRRAALLLLLLAIALGGPGLLGTYLLTAASAPTPLRLTQDDSQPGPSAAGTPRPGSASGAADSILITGVLYTNGPAKVNWNGVRIPVENTTYAYSGGELISTAPNAMGILKLDSGSVVFICPNSRVRVSRNAAGETLLEVMAGSGRFMFVQNEAFRVRVNQTTLGAAPDGSGDALTGHAYTGEGAATEDGGCVLCNLSKSLEVSVDGGHSGSSVVARGGQIVSVSGEGANPISSLDLPPDVFNLMRAAMVSNGATGLGYLCKCAELKDYAERYAAQPGLSLGTTLAKLSEQSGAPLSDAAPGLPQLPDARPAVAPPPVPDLTVAESGEPDPFVPGLLPAAGEPQPQTGTDVVVPPPLVPGSGTGGGGTVSSS